ncbi:3-phosphoshikimate 1-carboxyvinyltransferase [Paludibacterium purpuratum]|uniref:3-phosphoshikimate 1-carboxyvinyltransferase n=1 Tax=Paludibacterium purpuratum TaxID=1144873 RepID=A0A4R7BCY1_9NEIS|nr:3-phosphoshikimate 1-carboxyvinyltransferase [Paludibacterium purpuratum]TDR82831.1 3-phosphoshikimate 1-carboxyvinyltransferase [Paludibacterium purpuratum]
MEQLLLAPIPRLAGQLKLPGSKSISNRTLLLAALAEGETLVRDLLDSDDIRHMLCALQLLGVPITQIGQTRDFSVGGCGGNFPVKTAELFLGNAGTAFRPLTAALALMHGRYRLSGVPRMHERPIGDLVDALSQAGADIRYLDNPGYPPLEISPALIDTGKEILVKGSVSSQFLTALLMALPIAGREATVRVEGELISKPYISITLNLMRRFGIEVHRHGWETFTVPAGQHYLSPGEIVVEGDASSASYFLAAGVLAGGPVRVEGVDAASIQGDVRFADVLSQMGADIRYGDNWIEARAGTALRAVDIDLNHIPDAAMTVAMLALAADGTSRLRNIASWRVKETDRLAAMATELRKVGAVVEEGPDYIAITPPAALAPNAVIDTYDDHRMAMCFSLVALMGVPVTINDPKCVAKTFPDYFERLAALAKDSA